MGFPITVNAECNSLSTYFSFFVTTWKLHVPTTKHPEYKLNSLMCNPINVLISLAL